MADLNDLSAAQTIKIAGSDSSGIETNFVNATANNELKSADILNASVAQGTVSVTAAGEAIELKVGPTPLANRKSIFIQAQGSNVIFGFSSSIQPFSIANGTSMTLSVGDNISVYVKRSSGPGSVVVAFAEFA